MKQHISRATKGHGYARVNSVKKSTSQLKSSRPKEGLPLGGDFTSLINAPCELHGPAKPADPNGLPGQLKNGIERLSNISMDDVKVHYNSTKPARLEAHAYAQGSNIYVGPGQERHLPHEAWHVVQQMQGRVKATTSVGGMAVNDNVGLEAEADVMGGRALSTGA